MSEKNNSNQPAFPHETYMVPDCSGLTKREYTAIHILCGLSVQAIPGGHNHTDNQIRDLIPKAIQLTDELLKQLEFKNQPTA